MKSQHAIINNMEVGDTRFYKERRKAVEEIEQQELRAMTLKEHWQKLRSQTAVEVETVFGRIKQNWDFRRFTLRGLEEVKTEWGLLYIALNMAKLAVQ